MGTMMKIGVVLSAKDKLTPVLDKTSSKLGTLAKVMGKNDSTINYGKSFTSMSLKIKEGTQKVESAVSKMNSSTTRNLGIMTATLGAVTLGMSSVNNETAKMYNLTQTVGGSFQTVNAIAGSIKGIGLNYEHVTDTIEELTNKMGEAKQKYLDWLKEDKGKGKELKLIGGVDDAFKGLDFSLSDKSFKNLNYEDTFKKFIELSTNDQYELVIDTAMKMKDTQKAQAMADILMGGDANKIVGALRKQFESLEQLKKEKEKLNFLDKEGLDGALLYSKTVSDTKSIFGSMMSQFSGVGGAFMAPYLESANEYLAVNKEIIQQNITGFFDGLSQGIGTLGEILGKLYQIGKPIISMFSDTGEELSEVATSGEIAGETIAYLVGGLVALKAVTLVGAVGLKAFSTLMRLIPTSSKKATNSIASTSSAVDTLSRKTRKPLSLQMGMKAPAKKTMLSKIGSLLGSLSRFAIANPIVLGVVMSGAAFYGAYELYKKTLDRDLSGVNEKRIEIAQREEQNSVPLAQRIVSPVEAKEAKENIKKRRENLDNLSNKKTWTLQENLEKKSKKTLSMEEIERKLTTKEGFTPAKIPNLKPRTLSTKEDFNAFNVPKSNQRELITQEKLSLVAMPTLQDRVLNTKEVIHPAEDSAPKAKILEVQEKLNLATLPTLQDRVLNTKEVVEPARPIVPMQNNFSLTKDVVPTQKTNDETLEFLEVNPVTKETKIHKEVKVDAPIHIEVHAVQGEVDANGIAQLVQKT